MTLPSVVPAREVAQPLLSERVRLTRGMTVMLVGYVALVAALMLIRQAYLSPDLFVIFAAVVAVMLGRTRLFLRDWLPFVAIFIAWESMRGLADDLATYVISDELIQMDRFLFAGIVPSEWLQSVLHTAGSINALDILATMLYVAHFALPLVIGFLFWIRDRRLYYRYITALMVVSFAAFVCYLILPAAPPRYAGLYGEALAVRDIARETLARAEFVPIATWLYGSASGNEIAAFPSLHAAFPLLAYLFARDRWPRASVGVALYTLAVWFSIVYLGHHYVVDVLGGALLAIAAWAVFGRDFTMAWRPVVYRPARVVRRLVPVRVRAVDTSQVEP